MPLKIPKKGVGTWIPHLPLAASRTNKEIIRLLYLFFLQHIMIFICSINTYLDEMYSSLGCIKVQKMQIFIYFFFHFLGKIFGGGYHGNGHAAEGIRHQLFGFV